MYGMGLWFSSSVCLACTRSWDPSLVPRAKQIKCNPLVLFSRSFWGTQRASPGSMRKMFTVVAQTGNKRWPDEPNPYVGVWSYILGQGWGEIIYRLVNGMSDSPCICQRQHRCTHNLMYIQRKVWKNYMIKRPEKACIFKRKLFFY